MNCLYLRKATLLLVVFLHVSGIDAEDAGKCPLLKVQRGTIHKVFINNTFWISCDLMYCNKTFNVTWTKANIDKWFPVSEADQMSTSQNHSLSDPNILTSYLTFTKISKHHEGLYRCELQLQHFSTHSHHINVSVSDNILESEMTIERENTDSSPVSYPWWLPYLLICLGALIVILTVTLILILCTNACEKFKKKEYTESAGSDLLKSDEYVCVQYSEETHIQLSIST